MTDITAQERHDPLNRADAAPRPAVVPQPETAYRTWLRASRPAATGPAWQAIYIEEPWEVEPPYSYFEEGML